MELLYKIAGCVSYNTASNIVIYRAQQMQNMNIPVTAGPVNEDGCIMPAIKFSFYKRADEDFVDLFLNGLQSKMTLEGGEFYIANPYTGKKNGCLSSAEASSALKLAIKKRKEKKYEYVL